jgi:hypothetical protein
MSFFRSQSDGKQDLIRVLLADRVNESPAARDRGFTDEDVKRLGRVGLMSTPEATLVSIAEGLNHLIENRGVNSRQAMEIMEVQRRAVGALSALPDDFFVYGLQRVRLEHPTAQDVDEMHVRACMLAAERLTSMGGNSSQVIAAFYFGKYKALQVEHANQTDAVSAYLEGESTDDEFASAVDGQVARRRAFLKRVANKRASVRLQAAINDLEASERHA